MPSKNGHTYDEEFRRGAVEHWMKMGLSQRKAALELGVSEGSLREWRRRYFGGAPPGPGGGGSEPATLEEMAEVIRAQKKEIERFRRREEILKKAASILGEDPQSGMR